MLPIQGTGEPLYLITAAGGDLDSFNGFVGIDLAPTQDITDLSFNALQGDEPETDQTYQLDNLAPKITNVTIDDGT